jgi:hypothetical protein
MMTVVTAASTGVAAFQLFLVPGEIAAQPRPGHCQRRFRRMMNGRDCTGHCQPLPIGPLTMARRYNPMKLPGFQALENPLSPLSPPSRVFCNPFERKGSLL